MKDIDLKHPVRGKTAPEVVSVLKKCRFGHSETFDSFDKIGLKYPGNLKCMFDFGFLMMS